MKRILIVDDVHEVFMDIMNKHGFSCTYQPDISRAEALKILDGYEGLIVRSKFLITEEVLEHAGSLEFIGRAGAGMDNIDLEAAAKRDIRCFNAPEGNRDAVAEHTLGLLLALSNKLLKSDRQVRNQVWDRSGNRGIEIKGKTVGIIGYGYMGCAFAQRLQGFDCRVIAYDKYKQAFSDRYAQEVSLDQLLLEVDILSIHVPLTDETRAMVNKEFIGQFTKPFYYLNTSRGETQKMADVLQALQSGKIRAAGLDVLENEKLPLSAGKDLEWFTGLALLENVIFSPHTAGWTVESYFKISEVLAEKILNFYKISF